MEATGSILNDAFLLEARKVNTRSRKRVNVKITGMNAGV
jgi:hypothetical protein